MAAKKRSKYAEDRVRLRLYYNEDPEVQKYLEKCFKKDIQPSASFMEPEERGEDTVTVVAEGMEIGDIWEEDESLYYNNVKNTIRCYVNVDETEEDSGEYYCTVIIVVKKMITDEDLKKAKRNKRLIVVDAMILIGAIGVASLIRGQTLDGIVCIAMVPVIFYIGFIRDAGKDSWFYRKLK